MNYEPKGLALDIFKKRYAAHENETWEEACERVALHVSNAEQGDARVKYKTEFEEVLKKNWFMPGGRTFYGSGRAKGQLLNCFVIGTEDSREGWGETVKDMIVISGTGGGVGLNCSPVRPRNSPISGSGGVATGAVSLMEIINASGEVIKSGGGRRTALMLCLNLDHGDILEFLDKKLDLGKLNNANVSIVFDEDPEEFFRKVKNDENFELKFKGKVVGIVKAALLWSKIIRNALKNGEPGVLNFHHANKMSPTWYIAKLVSTNPCGEICMSPDDSCVLGSIVLPRFVTKSGEVRWKDMERAIYLGVRFLDDVITINNYPLPKIQQFCQEVRRIGLGVMGLHDMLLMLGHKYNSPEGLEFVDKLMGFIKNKSYESSIELAKEKGPFARFDAEKHLKGGFVKTLKPTIRKAIQEHGLRNAALNTMAPTGTTSMVADTSSGVESIFAPAYLRRWRKDDILVEDVVIAPLLKQFLDEGKDISHFQGAYDLSMRDHFEMQRVCQKHVDNAISKTINLKPGVSEEELSDLYMEYLPELKGVTVYPEGSRENQPLTPLSLDEAMLHYGNSLVGSAGVDSCKSGVCDI
jgi:ribonucleoside-diphosphate reductase alpha chain